MAGVVAAKMKAKADRAKQEVDDAKVGSLLPHTDNPEATQVTPQKQQQHTVAPFSWVIYAHN